MLGLELSLLLWDDDVGMQLVSLPVYKSSNSLAHLLDEEIVQL